LNLERLRNPFGGLGGELTDADGDALQIAKAW
jgi:hypothetical protein